MATSVEIRHCFAKNCGNIEKLFCQAGEELFITEKGECSHVLIISTCFDEGLSAMTRVFKCNSKICAYYQEAGVCQKTGIFKITGEGKCSGFKIH